MPIKQLILGGALAMAMTPALANNGPFKHTSCQVEINEPSNSSGYYMSQDCKTAYVLPPVKGDFMVDGYNSTVSDTDCDTLALIEDTNYQNETIQNATARAAARKGRKIEELEKMIEEGEIPSGTTADEIYEEIDELLAKVNEHEELFNRQTENYVEKKGLFAVMEGGVGTFSMTSGYADLMEDFRKLNAGKDVHFIRMPLKSTRISMVDDRFEDQKNRVEMRAVKRLLMAAGADEWVQVPVMNNMEVIASPESVDEESDLVGVQEAIFGEGMAGRIETSAIGNCAIKRAQEAGEGGSLASYIAARGVYEYDVMVKRNYSVTYNFKELITIIRESSKRGGFFSSKTVNKLIDNRSTTSWLKIHTDSDDGSFTYSDEDIKEIKKEFLDRALRQIIDIRTEGKASALALIDPGKNGASVVADELQKCGNLYCKIGAAGFRILNSIFGSSKATSEIRKRLEADVRETRTDVRPVTLIGTSAF